jgi:cytochrome c553
LRILEFDSMTRTFLMSALVLVSPMLSSQGVRAAGKVEETAQICASCHGEKGIPIDKTIPIIWGQNEGYLYLQLRDFKKGARKNDQMGPVAASLSKDDMKALAAYFNKKKWPDLQQPSAPNEVAATAQQTIQSIGCKGCHLDQFQGDGTTARLAGQQRDYLQKTMLAFRDHSRGNNPGMSDLMNAASPDSLKAVAEYLAGLQILGSTYGR